MGHQLRDRSDYKDEDLKSWSARRDALHDNVDRNIYILGNITGDILNPLARLVLEQNRCKHRIFSYAQ